MRKAEAHILENGDALAYEKWGHIVEKSSQALEKIDNCPTAHPRDAGGGPTRPVIVCATQQTRGRVGQSASPVTGS